MASTWVALVVDARRVNWCLVKRCFRLRVRFSVLVRILYGRRDTRQLRWVGQATNPAV